MLLNPKTIALIGATEERGSVGFGLLQNLANKRVFYVNPNKKKILGKKSYASILDIKEKIDLAIIAVPSFLVKKVSLEVVQKTKFVIIVSAGFAELGNDKLQKEIVGIFKENKVNFLGPNCMGFLHTHHNINASFAKEMPQKGNIAFLSQSGALMNAVTNYNTGFSFMASYGNGAGLGLSDLLEVANKDKNTKVIALYLEGLKDGRIFIKRAREIVKEKPIVVLKGGKTEQGKKAVSSHTASLAGEKEVYSAAFRKAGIFEVESLKELIDVSSCLSNFPYFNGGLCIITNGGAVGVLALDACSKLNINLSKVNFRGIKGISPFASLSNPFDIVGDAKNERYEKALDFILRKKEVKAVLVIQTLQVMSEPKELSKTILRFQKQYLKKPIIPLFLHNQGTIFHFSEIESCVLGIKALIERYKLIK